MVGVRPRDLEAFGVEAQFNILDRESAFAPENDAVFLLPSPPLRFDERDPLGQRPVHARRDGQLSVVDCPAVDALTIKLRSQPNMPGDAAEQSMRLGYFDTPRTFELLRNLPG